MKASVMSTPILQQRITELAEKRLVVEEKEGLLNRDDRMYASKKAQRKIFLEQSLQEVAEKLTDEMICKMESKTFIRGAYYLCSQLLTRAYHQGAYYIHPTGCSHRLISYRYTRVQRRSSSITHSGRKGRKKQAQYRFYLVIGPTSSMCLCS